MKYKIYLAGTNTTRTNEAKSKGLNPENSSAWQNSLEIVRI